MYYGRHKNKNELIPLLRHYLENDFPDVPEIKGIGIIFPEFFSRNQVLLVKQTIEQNKTHQLQDMQ